jgi:hypothetical protein
MSTSTSALKARHYNALANSLRQLQNGLSGSEEQMDRLAEHLGSMQKLGTHSAAQYVPSYSLHFPSLPFLPSHCFGPYLLIVDWHCHGPESQLTKRFMAVSRLLDKELVDLNIQHENEVRDAEEAVQAKQ